MIPHVLPQPACAPLREGTGGVEQCLEVEHEEGSDDGDGGQGKCEGKDKMTIVAYELHSEDAL